MSEEEFMDKRNTSNLSIKEFLLNRPKATIEVPITGQDGTINIEIRTMLNKQETNEHIKFITMLYKIESANDELFEKYSIPFLALITIDKELDLNFWSSNDIDPYVGLQLINAFRNEYK